MANVFRQMHRAAIELLGRAATLHAEHLVRFAYVDDERGAHQIGTECYLGGLEAVSMQLILKQA